MGQKLIYVLMLVVMVSLVQGATLHGEIYDLELEKVNNVLIEIDTAPQQQFLAKSGEYSLEVPPGKYVLRAVKDDLVAVEEINVLEDGDFVFDLFLFPSLEDEDEILSDLGVIDDTEEMKGFFEKYPLWTYVLGLAIILILMGRVLLAKKKYGTRKPLFGKRKEQKVEGSEEEKELVGEKSEEKETEEQEPGYLEEALEIIKKNDGRMTQKELRQEMMHLSEAKVSLILTELEHKGQVERIKKGRGKVVILK